MTPKDRIEELRNKEVIFKHDIKIIFSQLDKVTEQRDTLINEIIADNKNLLMLAEDMQAEIESDK